MALGVLGFLVGRSLQPAPRASVAPPVAPKADREPAPVAEPLRFAEPEETLAPPLDNMPEVRSLPPVRAVRVDDVCTRHNMRKTYYRGGKTWRCVR